MTAKIRVSIVSSSRLFRGAVASRLAKENQLEVVGASASARGLLRTNGPVRIDVVLVHSKVLSMEVVDTIYEIKAGLPAVHVILLGCTQNEAETLTSIEAGASALLEHDASSRLLLQTIQAVVEGRAAGSMLVLAGVARRLKQLEKQGAQIPQLPLERLTACESVVARFVGIGMLNKEIASAMGVKTPTVKRHVHNILAKLRLHSRREVNSQKFGKG